MKTLLSLVFVILIALSAQSGAASAAPVPEPVSPDDAPVLASPVNDGGSRELQACAAVLYYYYNSNLQGATRGFCGNIPDLAGFKYTDPGTTSAGLGQNIKNNAASIKHVANAGGGLPVVVYYNSNYNQGAPQWIADRCVPGCQGNLTAAMKNNNASHQWTP